MNFKEVVLDSLKYPFSNLKNLTILFLLSIFQITIIPAIIIGGYLIRIIESTLEGSSELPDFTNITKLLGDGIKFAVVSIIYGIPILLINFTVPYSLPTSEITSLIISLMINIVFLMALPNMVYEKKFIGAFRFKKIFHLIGEVSWKKYIAYLLFYTLIANLISSIYFLLTPDYLLDYISDFGLAYFFGSIPAITYITTSNVILAYTTAFDGRLRGLIYPVHGEEE